jgi:hypothetical protein
MSTAQLLLRLPDDLVRRLRARVSPRQRSAFVQRLLEQALPPDVEEDPLYQVARLVEADETLNADMADWDALAGDGIADAAPPARRRL